MKNIIGQHVGSGIEQHEIREKIIEHERELRSASNEMARREIRERIFKLQEQLNNLVRLYGRKG